MRSAPRARGNPGGARFIPTTVAAWDRRVKSGQAGGQMTGQLNNLAARAS